MTLNAVAADDPITAELNNQFIDHANTSRGRAVFTANGTWAVPSGVHNFIVYLAGGGGGGGNGIGVLETGVDYPGTDGGDSPLGSKVISGLAVGTSIAIVIGTGGVSASGTGTISTFGALMQSTGGGPGGSHPSTTKGTRGTHTGSPASMSHGQLFLNESAGGRAYGAGGTAGLGVTLAGNGIQGICVIEW